jgi:hypothetical protein
MSSVPINTTETIEQHVMRLLTRWREETAFLSSTTNIRPTVN